MRKVRGTPAAGLIGMLVTAAVAQMIELAGDSAHGLAAQANNQMIFNPNSGLLLGPYHPGYETDLRGR